MAKNPQTYAKRARELALRERRERKLAKKAEAAAQRAAAKESTGEPEQSAPSTDAEPEDV